MEKRLDFRFEIPAQPKGPLIEMSAAEVEKTLLKRVEDEKAEPTEALWQLARFYQQSKQIEKGFGLAILCGWCINGPRDNDPIN